MSKVIIACGHCKEPLELTNPTMLIGNTAMLASVMLVPMAGMEERTCKKCGFVTFPAFQSEPAWGWLSAPPPPQQQRIVTPTGQQVDLLSRMGARP